MGVRCISEETGKMSVQAPAGFRGWREDWRLSLLRLAKRVIGAASGAQTGICGRRFPAYGPLANRRHVRFTTKCDPEMVRYIRERAVEFASAMPFTSTEMEDIRLVVGEAAANAVRHGANPKWPKVGVEFRRRGDTLFIALWDKGRGFEPSSLCHTPECLAEGGRGVFFMKALMDDVRFRFTRPGTRVEMTKTPASPR